jgi:hypothetical protein
MQRSSTARSNIAKGVLSMSQDWTDEEVCCGFLWFQFENFSNHVKFCPCCGSELRDIPEEALE